MERSSQLLLNLDPILLQRTIMASAIQDLTDYAVSITYDDIPADLNERAKACITDTVGVRHQAIRV